MNTIFSKIGGLLILAAVYFASARLGLSLAFVAEQVSPVWPPTGIALAAILLFGFRVWPGIAVGAFLANAIAHEPIPTACGIAIGNTLEAFIGAWLLRRVGFNNSLERVRDAIALILLAAGISTMVSATIGVTSLCLGGVELSALRRTIEWSDFGRFWWVWWLGDAMGALVVAPVLLTWSTARGQLPLRRPVEAIALLAGLVATSIFIFVSGFTSHLEQSSLAYIVFPFVIWAALRFGQPGTTFVTLIASGLTILATLHSLGPFGLGPIHDRLLMLQMFMGVVAITGLLLGAALAERHRAESELRKSEDELRESDRLKDEFLATLSHELRNPLAPIRSAVDLMRLSDLRDPKLNEVLEMLDRQVRHMARLVDDLLDVSRVNRGKIRLQLQPVDLATVIARAIETSRPQIDSSGQELSVELPAEPLPLHADPTRLAQVFSNLLNNAAKYSERGGRIALSAAQEDDAVVVRVRDTGRGIDPAILPRVFDLFVQGDRSISRAEGGLGIGLTLVFRLVEMHGGSVRAFSEGRGKGSEFVIRLPLDLSPRSGTVAPSPSSHLHDVQNPCRILIVDDNVDAARSLELLLKTAGHEVFTAHTGSAALDAATVHRPDLVLLDIGLPVLDGYEVARRIRQLPSGKDIALIALTGWGQPDDRRRAAEAGFDHHLTKPVDLAKLNDIIVNSCAAATSTRPVR